MPKIMGDNLADHRRVVRTRLFEALSELMTEHHFKDITMSQIAARADVGRTAVYNHFADKESLLLAYITETTEEFVDDLRARVHAEKDPTEQLRIYLAANLEMRDTHHLIPGVDLRRQLSPHSSQHLHDHAAGVVTLLGEILERAMESGRIPRQNREMLSQLIHSTLAGQPLPPDGPEREDVITLTIAFILRGIGIPEGEAPLPPGTRTSLDFLSHAHSTTHHGMNARCPIHR